MIDGVARVGARFAFLLTTAVLRLGTRPRYLRAGVCMNSNIRALDVRDRTTGSGDVQDVF